MEIKRTVLSTAMSIALGGASLGASAALTTGALLLFDPVPGGTTQTRPADGSGSWFSHLTGDSDSDYYPDTYTYTPMAGFHGIQIGLVQGASGSHGGAPGCDPSASVCTGAGGPGENPDIDQPWEFFGSTGMHLTNSPITEVGSTAGGAHLLDFSGWDVIWNGTGFELGDPANFPSDTNLATITCSTSSCSAGSTFTLEYSAHHGLGNPANTGGIQYALHLEGIIATPEVPLPAALWLFGSGLAGLTCAARRRRRR